MREITKRLAAGLALAALLAIVLATPVEAGNCVARSRAVYTTYTTYAAPAKAAVYQQQAVTYTPTTKIYVSPDVYNGYYSSVTDWYRDAVLVNAVAGKVAEQLKSQEQLQSLREEIGLLRRQLLTPQYPSNGQQQPPPAYQAQPEQQQQLPPKQRMPKASGRLPPVPDRLQAVVGQACLRCHGATHEKAGGGLDLTDLASVPRETRLASYMLTNTGEMPRGGKPLSDADVLLFYTWASGRQVMAQK